ncbi:MAG TPA: hemin uptake protein HemP [Porticoccaceae bacterium]|nr:hemin uptake protein HemP [Porticoccaceae bacterium]
MPEPSLNSERHLVIRKQRTSSKDLLGDESTLEIEHEGATYLLRKTKQGKLILTK